VILSKSDTQMLKYFYISMRIIYAVICIKFSSFLTQKKISIEILIEIKLKTGRYYFGSAILLGI